MYLVPVLFTFYVQGVLKLIKNNSGAKRLIIKDSKFGLHGVCMADHSAIIFIQVINTLVFRRVRKVAKIEH